MSIRDLIGEAWASAIAQKIPTATVALLAAAMCLVTLLTVGRTAHAQEQVQQRLEAAGSRVLVVESTKPELDLIPAAVADAVAGLSIADRAVATSFPQDVVLAAVPGVQRTPLWWTRGDLSDIVTLTQGRWPGTGEAIVSATVAHLYNLDGLAGAITTATGEELAIVGVYTPIEPFTSFESGSLTPDDGRHQLNSLTVVASSAETAVDLQSAVMQIIAAPDPQALRISSPATLADAQEAVGADLTRFSRSLLLLVLLAGGTLTAIVVLADALVRQRDLGRRRALGIDRYSLVALVTARTCIAAAAGVSIGTLAGIALTLTATPPTPFILGVAALTLLTAAVAALPPALLAAYRDPVAVLRTA